MDTCKTEKNKDTLELKAKIGSIDNCCRNSEKKRRLLVASGVGKGE